MNRWHLKQAARIVECGGLIAYPTEAVYGLGCDPQNSWAVERLLRLKGRAMEKGVILIAANFTQLRPYLGQLNRKIIENIKKSWPGPVTWTLPAAADTSPLLRGAHSTIAVRVTAHPLAAALCRTLGGALVSTSANRSGRPAARSALQVRRTFGKEIDCLLNGNPGRLRNPTEIRNGLTGRVIRSGS